MRKGIMALEGLEDVAVDTAPEGDVTEFTEAPENDIIELQEATGEVDAIDADIGEAADTAETVEAMTEAVSDAVEEGGMSEPAAEAVRLAVEHMKTRLGFPKSAYAFPAMEGFADKGSRVKNTKLVMESLKEMAAKIWEAIVRAFNQAITWIKNVYKSVTDGALRLKKRADAIAAAAKAAGDKPGVGTVAASGSLGGFAKVLHQGGTVPEGAAFVKAFADFTKSAKEIGRSQVVFAEKGQTALGNLIESTKDGAAFEQAGQSVAAAFAAASHGAKSGNKELAGEGVEVLELALPFGDKSFYSIVPSDKSALSAGKTKFVLGTTTGAKPVDKLTKDVAALSAKEVGEVAAAASAHMGEVDDFKSAISMIEKAEATVKSKASKDAGDDKEAAARIKVAAAAARAYISAVTKGAADLRSYDISVTKGALDYAAASLKGGKAPEAAKEAEKAAA